MDRTFLPQTRAEALTAWQQYLPHVRLYGSRRNHVIEGHPHVSRLSVALRHRVISEDEIISDTLRHFPFAPVEKWLQEICWRRYWKGWLEMRPDVWHSWRRRVAELRQSLPAEVLEKADAVAAGKSGVACMDAFARELIETGYLHNHARMWWASFWIHAEKLPWELGADVFFRHLHDADAASNTLSWRWVAGLQTPGKTYLVRLDNLKKYLAPGLLTNLQGAERLADGAVTPQIAREHADLTKSSLPAYPQSLPPLSPRCGLWLHADDLLPEIGPLSELKPVSIAVIHSSALTPAARAALDDSIARAEAHYACKVALVTVEEIAAWSRAHQLTEVVAFAPFVGPEQELLEKFSPSLVSLGIPLTLLRRASDARAFSYAGSGFFPFWKKMSRDLASPLLL
jgi:deoxyribodipyrimidine photo-lyase